MKGGLAFVASMLGLGLLLSPCQVDAASTIDAAPKRDGAWSEAQIRQFANRHRDAKEAALIAYFTKDGVVAAGALETFISVVKDGMVPQNPVGLDALRYELLLAHGRLAILHIRANKSASAEEQILEAIKYAAPSDKSREGVLKLVHHVDSRYADCARKYKGGDSFCN